VAWQLQYTSAESGPTGRAGFQFTAETPGLPAGVHARVGPYLRYRPPPAAAIAPTPEQIRALPVALAYGPLGDRLRVLSRCVYLGRDYSGRYGNFLGHALVLTPAELAGLRPVEFWDAPFWADSPAPPGTALPEPAELVPGEFTDPETLGEWLRAGGDAAYRRLGVLLGVTWRALGRGHGRLILVDERVEEIVRWIAVISYSLPGTFADRLSFVTYSADPANAAQTIVGTTPDVWLPADHDATVVRLADPPPPEDDFGAADESPLPFIRAIVVCWRAMDLDTIDAIADLCDAASRPPAHAPRDTSSGTPPDDDGVGGRLFRVEATHRLMSLRPAAPRRDGDARGEAQADDGKVADLRESALRTIWREPPTPDECAALVERLGTRMSDSGTLSDLPARVYLTAEPDRPEAARLARLVADHVPGYAACDAEAVLLVARLAEAHHPEHAAAHLDRLTALIPEVNPALHAATRRAAAHALSRRLPAFRGSVVAAAAEQTARWLVAEWLARRRMSRDEQLALIEIAIRLRRSGRIVPALDDWARDRATGWSLFAWADFRFRHDTELAAGLRELRRLSHAHDPTARPRWRRDEHD